MSANLITPMTSNVKLGPGVAASYRPVGDASLGQGTCPSNCPLLPSKGGKCYTRKFHTNIQQNNSRSRFDDLNRFREKGAKFVRLHVSGDFFMPSDNEEHILDTQYMNDIIAWCRENADITVWTYTHDVSKLIEAGYTYANGSFPENLHILASVESETERQTAKDFGFRTAQVIDSESDKPEGTTLCPYDLAIARKIKDKTNCAKCQLCFNPNHKKDIAFIKH